MRTETLLALGLLLSASPAFSQGGSGSHGAVVWKCPSGVYLADVAAYEMKFPTQRRENAYSDSLPNVFDMIAAKGLDFIAQRLDLASPGAGAEVVSREAALHFQPSESNQPLPLLNDDGLPAEMTIDGQKCTKAQLAIQDVAHGVVTEDTSLRDLLSAADRVLYPAHEALVSLERRPSGTTEPIRAELMEAVTPHFPGFSGKVTPYVGQISSIITPPNYPYSTIVIKDHVPVNSKTFKNFTIELALDGCAFGGNGMAAVAVPIGQDGSYTFPPTPYNLYDKSLLTGFSVDDGDICVTLTIRDGFHDRIEGRNDNGEVSMVFDERFPPSSADVQKALSHFTIGQR
jgi:hypothetical protein